MEDSRQVSVIIPSYNRAELVVEAIQSVLSQTCRPGQIIVVDDGSKDNTAAVVSQFPEVEYFFQENCGQSSAWGAGLIRAEGKYIALLDSDDLWDCRFLEESLRCLVDKSCGLVWSNYRTVELSGSLVTEDQFRSERPYLKRYVTGRGDWSVIEYPESASLFSQHLPLFPSSCLFRNDFIRVPPASSLAAAPDLYFFTLNVMGSRLPVAFNKNVLVTQRVGTSNIRQGSRRVTFLLLNDLGIFEEIRRVPGWSAAQRRALRRRTADVLDSLAYYKRLERDFRSAVDHQINAFVLSPRLAFLHNLLKILFFAMLRCSRSLIHSR